MKVYMVMEGFEYEGESVVAVFADRAKAEQHMALCEAEDENDYYSYTINEAEVIE